MKAQYRNSHATSPLLKKSGVFLTETKHSKNRNSRHKAKLNLRNSGVY